MKFKNMSIFKLLFENDCTSDGTHKRVVSFRKFLINRVQKSIQDSLVYFWLSGRNRGAAQFFTPRQVQLLFKHKQL